MGRPTSLDLRERVAALHAAGELTPQQMAGQRNLGVATGGRWVRRARAEGSAAAHPSGRGPAPPMRERADGLDIPTLLGGHATALITGSDARAWCRHCGVHQGA